MFESLTRLIPELQRGPWGEWRGGEGAGTLEDPKQMPYISYNHAVHKLIQGMYEFHEKHPEFGLNDYFAVLKQYGIEERSRGIENTDIFTLESKPATAMLMEIIRADRINEGLIEMYLENGVIIQLLNRLKEIDLENYSRDGEEWDALFFAFDNEYFGPYDAVGCFSMKEYYRLEACFGDPVSKADTESGPFIFETDIDDEIMFFFLDTRRKIITPMEKRTYAFSTQYDDSPVGEQITLAFNPEEYTCVPDYKDHPERERDKR